MQPIIENIVYW